MPDRRYWDAVHSSWQRSRPQELWRRHSDAVDIAWLRALLPAGRARRMLKTDLFNEGIGPGLYPDLAPAAESVIGMDLSVGAARAAGAQYPALLAVGADVRRLPFASGSFDLIVSNSTLDHFESAADIPRSLVEMQRVLRTGGHLLVSLDNRANPFVALRNSAPGPLLQRLGIVPYYVGATFGPRRLRRALQESGFQVISASAVLHCPRVVAVAACSIVERLCGPAGRARFLRLLVGFERLGRLPTRYVSGHLIVVKAQKVA